VFGFGEPRPFARSRDLAWRLSSGIPRSEVAGRTCVFDDCPLAAIMIDNNCDHVSTEPPSKLCDRAEDRCAMCKEVSSIRVVRSEELLLDQRELFILHGGQVYRLLRTRNDKLLLQK
jgi:hemin uptake protein HemP